MFRKFPSLKNKTIKTTIRTTTLMHVELCVSVCWTVEKVVDFHRGTNPGVVIKLTILNSQRHLHISITNYVS